MVQIPQYEQQVAIGAPSRSTPNVNTSVDTSIGQAVVNLGNTLGNIQDKIDQRNLQKAEFDAKVGYDTYTEKMGQLQTELERNAPADGTGLHDQLLTKRSQIAGDFLSTITNPELRAKYQTILDTSDAEHWSNIGANSEWKIANTYTVGQTETMWQKRGQAIAVSPADVQGYVDEMVDTIDKAPNLTPAQREEMKKKIREQGPKIAAEALANTDPETLYFASGRGTNPQRVAFLQRRLVPAIIGAESGGDPGVVSPVGAVGLMQVMPDTAVQIAEKLGDKGFLSLSRPQQIQFLKNPQNSRLYGTTYINMMLERYDGDVEAALVAYNAGPGNADKWLKEGRDYRALPKPQETQPYVQRVMRNMGAAKLVSGAPVRVADASGTGGIPMSDASPDGVPGGGEPGSGFVSPAFSNLPADDLVNIQKVGSSAYQKATQAQLVQDEADKILSEAGANNAGPGDREVAYRMLGGISDAELKKDVAPLIESHFNRWEKVQKDEADRALASTWSMVDAALERGDASAAFVIANKAIIPQADRDKMLDRIAKGPVRDDNPLLVQSLDAMRFSDPKQFMEIDFRKVGDLTNPTLRSYQELQAKMRADAQKATSDQITASDGLMKDNAAAETSRANQINSTFSKANPIVDQYFLETGIPTDKEKMTPADAQHANLVRSLVAKELEIAQQASKTPLTITQIQDTVDAVMKTYPRFKPVESSWMPWRKGDTDVNMNEVLQAFDDAKMDVNQAADALRKAGQPVNSATLQNALELYKASHP